VPVGVIENALNVRVLAPVVGFGLKVANTPGGGLSTNKKTGLLKPPTGVILIRSVPVEPCANVKLLVEAESRKSGCDGGGAGALTVRLMVVVCVRLPDFPVMVTVTVPVVAVLLAVSVKVLELAVGLELNDGVTPLGKPEVDNVTLLLKPFAGVMVIVLLPLEPCAIVRLRGEADREKSG
jgi:hypothetical protein